MIQQLRTLRTRMPVWGFTLIELAIVLGIAGILFAGLWRLMSGGNQALRDQATATAQTQLINAAKGYLASTQGKTFMQSNNATTTPFSLALPTSNTSNANCKASIASVQDGFCDYLPLGFTTASANPYGQTFGIKVVGDGNGTGAPPVTYSFMILTSGGNAIPDTSGGRIAASIGGDGGFVYSNNVCGNAPSVQNWACGAYGAWAADINAVYGFAVPGTGGYVASRSYYTPEQSSNLPWLARGLQPGDTNTTPNFNTMRTSMLMSQASAAAIATSLYFNTTGTIAAPVAGLGFISMNGGNINMGAGTLNMNAGLINAGGGAGIAMGGAPINLGGGTMSNGYISLVTPQPPPSAFITLNTGCSLVTTAGCTPALLITAGDISVPGGEVNANQLYATGFIYGTVVPPSDFRLKTNIQPLHDALDNMEKLKPVSYNFKSGGRPSYGVIAQDLEKVYPQLVIDRPDGYKGVEYDGLIAPLIGAVQELKKENDQLRLQLNQQAARQDKLEHMLKEKTAP